MTEPKSFTPWTVSSGGSLAGVAGRLLRSPWGLTGLAAVMLVAGAVFNWSWLVAAGVAPLLLSVAPCITMCALGLCMANMSRRNRAGASTDIASNSSIGAPSLQSDDTSCCLPPQDPAQLSANVAKE
jgi:hypothetical protein